MFHFLHGLTSFVHELRLRRLAGFFLIGLGATASSAILLEDTHSFSWKKTNEATPLGSSCAKLAFRGDRTVVSIALDVDRKM